MNFLKDGLSISETRISVLIVLCILATLFSLVMYYLNGDISSNLVDVVQMLVLSIAGVNVADKVSGLFNRKNG